MYTETNGIVIRQTKTASGRRMIVILTEKFGKISAGTNISERGASKAALALRPFCCGKYELFKGRESFSLNAAQAVESFYSIGENIDKFAAASLALELSDRLLEEGQPAGGMYRLLFDFLSVMESRKSDFGTVLLAFRIKALELSGVGLSSERCTVCGKEENLGFISVKQGGPVCSGCLSANDRFDPLIFGISDDIIKVIGYIRLHPLKNIAGLSVPKESQKTLSRILKAYYSYHLGIEDLRSESLIV